MANQDLIVSLQGKEVGRLMATRRGARFAYNGDLARERVGMPLLSLSLPVKVRPYAEGLTGSWFRGVAARGPATSGHQQARRV